MGEGLWPRSRVYSGYWGMAYCYTLVSTSIPENIVSQEDYRTLRERHETAYVRIRRHHRVSGPTDVYLRVYSFMYIPLAQTVYTCPQVCGCVVHNVVLYILAGVILFWDAASLNCLIRTCGAVFTPPDSRRTAQTVHHMLDHARMHRVISWTVFGACDNMCITTRQGRRGGREWHDGKRVGYLSVSYDIYVHTEWGRRLI